VDNQIKKGSEQHSIMTAERFIYDFRKQIRLHQRVATTDGYIHNTLQFLIITGAASVPILLTINSVPKLYPTIISLAVAVATGLVNIYRYKERSLLRFEAFRDMSREMNLYDLHEGSYKELDPEKAFSLFFKQAEELQNKHFQSGFFGDKPKQNSNQVDA